MYNNAVKRIPKGQKIKTKFSCDICLNSEYLVQHHIRGREIYNANHPFNLCDIYSNCHYEIHLGRIIIEGWVMTTGGRTLLWRKQGEESVTGDDATPHIISAQSQ